MRSLAVPLASFTTPAFVQLTLCWLSFTVSIRAVFRTSLHSPLSFQRKRKGPWCQNLRTKKRYSPAAGTSTVYSRKAPWTL